MGQVYSLLVALAQEALHLVPAGGEGGGAGAGAVPRARSAAARKVWASELPGSRTSTVVTRSRTTCQSIRVTASSASSSNRSIRRWIRSLTKARRLRTILFKQREASTMMESGQPRIHGYRGGRPIRPSALLA